MIRRGVLIADGHYGSSVGLVNPDHIRVADRDEPVRDAIWKQWVEAAEGPWHAPDWLIIDGDMIEGQNRRGTGEGVLTNDLDSQIDGAASAIGMWGAGQTWELLGSGYHGEAGSTGLRCEESLARKIGAEPFPCQGDIPEDEKNRSGWHLFLTLAGVTFHLQHVIGVNKNYKSSFTGLAGEVQDTMISESLAQELRGFEVDVVVRAHIHRFRFLRSRTRTGIVLPGWKACDTFVSSRGPLRIYNDVGFIGFEIDDNGGISWHENYRGCAEVQPPPHIVVP